MKLWVDDIRNAPDDTWTVARTVLSAIRAISKFDFAEISLDHDISHQVAVGALSRPYPCEETFESVAHYIVAVYGYAPGAKRPKIIVHSSNVVGSEKIMDILKHADLEIEYKPMGLANRLEMEV